MDMKPVADATTPTFAHRNADIVSLPEEARIYHVFLTRPKAAARANIVFEIKLRAPKLQKPARIGPTDPRPGVERETSRYRACGVAHSDQAGDRPGGSGRR